MGSKNYIEINGKKYDAITGKILDSNTLVSTKTQPATVVSPRMNTGVVDGFVRMPKVSNVPRSTPNRAPKQTQKSQTLMRTAVKKPQPVAKKIQSSKPSIQKSHLGTSPKRTQTAMQTPKSQHIQKFGSIDHRTSVIKKDNHNLTVVQPKTQSNHSQVTRLYHNNSISSQNKSIQTNTNHIARENMINNALENASAHESVHQETNHKKKHKRLNKLSKKLGISKRATALSSAVLAAVLLAGFFTIQNVPNLSMRLAASRAGFDAQMPEYKPSGFSFKGPINYSPGQVTISFKSNSDNRYYDVKQQASNWNSDALLSNFVVAEGKTYQTYLDKGRTLFIYDGSNATWVDNGVWYQVEGDSDMTTDQLIRIASSI